MDKGVLVGALLFPLLAPVFPLPGIDVAIVFTQRASKYVCPIVATHKVEVRFG